MLLHGFWLIHAARLVKNLQRTARRIKENRFQRMLDDLRQLYEFEPRVRLLATDRIGAPLVVGAFRPAILLPADHSQWPSQRIAMVLSHELAHIQRRDLFWQLLGRLSAAIYWFHPLVWLAVRRMRLERERACDDRVLLAGIEPTDYATGLVECAAALRGRPMKMALGISMAQPSQLETRIRSILDASLKRAPVSVRVRQSIIAATTALVLTLSLLRPFSPVVSTAAESAPAEGKAAAAAAQPEAAQSPAPEPAPEPAAEAKPAETPPAASPPAAPPVETPPAETPPAASPPASKTADKSAGEPDGKTIFVNNPTAPISVSPGEMYTCTFSGNDKFLAACGGGEWMNKQPGWARIWDVETRQEVAAYTAPRGIFCIGLSPDGRRVATATWNSDVVLREVGGRELRKVVMKRSPRFAFSPDGYLLAVADERKDMHVLDGVTGKDLDGFGGDKMECMWMGFSADGSLLGMSGGAYAEADRNKSPQVAAWDVASRRQVFKATGLPNRVYISALSPDNKTFAAGCNNLIWLYDIATGMLREQIKTPHSFIRGLKYSPDGSILASSGGNDGAIVLWDTANWEPKGTLKGHASRVRGLSFTRDGRTLASAGSDQAVLLWDVPSQTQTGALQQPVVKKDSESETPRFLAIAYAPGGQQLAAAGDDGRVSIYELAGGKVLRTWQAHDDAVSSLAYSPDGQTLASGGYDKVVQLWNASTGDSLGKLAGHKSWVVSLAFSPDGTQLASGSYDRSIVVWNPADGTQRRVLEGHSATVRSLAFSPDGKLLASGSADRSVKLWDAAAGTELATLTGHEGAIRGIAFSPDGKTLASGGEDRLIKLWNVDDTRRPGSAFEIVGKVDGSLRATLTGHSDMVAAVAFAGPTLISASWDHTIRTWDSQTGAFRAKLDVGRDPVIAIAIAPDGRQLLSASAGGSFKVWNASQGEDRPLFSFGPFGGKMSVAFSPDGNRFAVGAVRDAGDTNLRVFDRDSADPKFDVDFGGDLQNLAWSPRGDLLALGFPFGFMLVDAATGAEVGKTQQGGGSRGLAFSADGKLLATASSDQVVRVYDVDDGTLNHQLKGHKTAVVAVAFSPDGAELLSTCEDHSAIVWSLASGERRDAAAAATGHDAQRGLES